MSDGGGASHLLGYVESDVCKRHRGQLTVDYRTRAADYMIALLRLLL